MQQIRITAHGGPEVLQLIDVDRPTPPPGQALIRVEAIGVNYSDVLRRRDEYFVPTPVPFVLGTEAVGVIEALGEGAGVGPLAVGARVLAALPGGGGYAEYVLADPAYCIPLPPHLPAEVATAIFVQGSTAALLSSEVAGPLAGKRVLVTAAAGGVGSLLTQLLAAAGAEVVAATSTDAKAELLAGSEAVSEVLVYGTEDWAASAKTHDAQGFDLLFDAVGGSVFAAALTLVKDGGRAIVYGSSSREAAGVHTETFVDRNLGLASFNLAHYIQHHPQLWQRCLGEVIGGVAAGTLRVDVRHRYSLGEAARAHADLEARRTTGKVVLTTAHLAAA